MAILSAVILAGGLGTRLRSVVPDLPKPMAPIEGRPFLEYQLDYWIAQGIERFVLAVGYRHEAISGHFGDSYRSTRLDYVIEDTPLGTGGGVLLALEKLPEEHRFLLLNGDTYFTVELPTLEQFAASRDSDWCFSLFRTVQTSRYLGMGVAEDGRITELKSSQKGGECFANGGVYCIHPRAFSSLGVRHGDCASLENDLFPRAFAAGHRMVGLAFEGSFIDIGIPDDYHRAASLLKTKDQK
jgi:D-glycero-alpha-D-manno-heptose 1-phosphate guanylyltransferase